MIDDAIYSALSGAAGVTAITSTRIYLMKMQQGAAVPAITFHKVSAIPTPHIDNTQSKLDTARYQINSWDKSQRGAKTLSLAVRSALDGLNTTLAGIRIFGIIFSNEVDFYEDETGLHHVAQDYRVIHHIS